MAALPTIAYGEQQFIRSCALLVTGNNRKSTAKALDLSEFRIKFSIKRSDTMTPNVADIRVYNVSRDTAIQIANPKEFSRVILQAGYQSNYGVIFQGNIKQVIIGRESATDTFIDIIAGDGDRAYNFAVVNTTIAKGSTQTNQVAAAFSALAGKGINAGNMGTVSSNQTQLPRGKVMYGSAKHALRNVAKSTDNSWSIQDEQLTFISTRGFLPGERPVLTAATGMIGTPEQTNEGINVKCLINPNIKVGGLIQIDNKSLQRFKINLAAKDQKTNIPAPVTADGVYYVLVIEHTGDTRGIEWYSSLLCLNNDITSNPYNSVQVNYGNNSNYTGVTA